jgi:hypothetical protein
MNETLWTVTGRGDLPGGKIAAQQMMKNKKFQATNCFQPSFRFSIAAIYTSVWHVWVARRCRCVLEGIHCIRCSWDVRS